MFFYPPCTIAVSWRLLNYFHRRELCEYSSHRICVCMSLILSDDSRDKTKTAETKITKFGTGIVHRDTSPTTEY